MEGTEVVKIEENMEESKYPCSAKMVSMAESSDQPSSSSSAEAASEEMMTSASVSLPTSSTCRR